MRWSSYAGLAACLAAGGLIWSYGAGMLPSGAVTPATLRPEDGRVAGGVYTNAYFDLSYPLPEGWTEGEAGPKPSSSGYYVLSTLVPKAELAGTVLISAQDMLFAPEAHDSTALMAAAFHREMSRIDGMTVDGGPTEMRIAGSVVHRVDFSGVGLHRSMFVAERRCHFVIVNLTARDFELLARLRFSVNSLFSSGARRPADVASPPCVRNYAVADNLVRRVEPEPVGAGAEPVPVRLVIDAKGGVKHVRVIRASPGQRNAIEAALRQWQFKPHQVNGRAVDIETGLLFQFATTQR